MRYVEVADGFRIESRPWRAVFRCIKTVGHVRILRGTKSLETVGGVIEKCAAEDFALHRGVNPDTLAVDAA